MDVTNEISKLVKFSPKRNAVFDKLKEELSPDTPGFRVLCPTRWTVRAKSLKSVQNNYSVLQELWDYVLDGNVHPEIRARVIGVRAQMETFDYFFGISIADLVLSHGDNLSAALQSSTISATEGQRIASLTITTLLKMRTDESFTLFWNLVQKKAGSFDVSEPSLPRPRKLPKRFKTIDETVHFPATVEAYYSQIYFEVLDYSVCSIKARFDQPGYQMFRKVEDLLLKSVRGEIYSDELSSVTKFYGDDLCPYRLSPQLSILSAQLKDQEKLDLNDIMTYMKGFSSEVRVVFSEVVKLLNIILVNPTTNAISERSFSALRRLKTYLRSTMGQPRLNAVILLHIHKEKTDQLSIIDLTNQFSSNEHRMDVFGTFTRQDM